MNPVITVSHLLTLFPHRKKSWAYRELQTVKDATKLRYVRLSDLASFFGWDLASMQKQLSGSS